MSGSDSARPNKASETKPSAADPPRAPLAALATSRATRSGVAQAGMFSPKITPRAAEHDPGGFLKAEEGAADDHRDRTQQADEDAAPERERRDLHNLLRGALAFQHLDEDERRADGTWLDEAEQAERDRQGDQVEVGFPVTSPPWKNST